jgi:hypothetical protein
VVYSSKKSRLTTARRKKMQWETPQYTVVEVCAEVTGYFHRG